MPILIQLLIFTALVGSLIIAIHDPEFRPLYAELAKILISGYLGYLVPKANK